jgi:hypothetical protein
MTHKKITLFEKKKKTKKSRLSEADIVARIEELRQEKRKIFEDIARKQMR